MYWIYMKHWPTIPSHSSQTSSAGSAAACCDGFTVAPGVMAKMSDQQSTWKNLGKIWATSGQEIWIRALGLATRKLSKTQAFSQVDAGQQIFSGCSTVAMIWKATGEKMTHSISHETGLHHLCPTVVMSGSVVCIGWLVGPPTQFRQWQWLDHRIKNSEIGRPASTEGAQGVMIRIA